MGRVSHRGTRGRSHSIKAIQALSFCLPPWIAHSWLQTQGCHRTWMNFYATCYSNSYFWQMSQPFYVLCLFSSHQHIAKIAPQVHFCASKNWLSPSLSPDSIFFHLRARSWIVWLLQWATPASLEDHCFPSKADCTGFRSLQGHCLIWLHELKYSPFQAPFAKLSHQSSELRQKTDFCQIYLPLIAFSLWSIQEQLLAQKC